MCQPGIGSQQLCLLFRQPDIDHASFCHDAYILYSKELYKYILYSRNLYKGQGIHRANTTKWNESAMLTNLYCGVPKAVMFWSSCAPNSAYSRISTFTALDFPVC